MYHLLGLQGKTTPDRSIIHYSIHSNIKSYKAKIERLSLRNCFIAKTRIDLLDKVEKFIKN